MAARRLLLLDSSSLSAHGWHSSGPVEEARFAADADGFRAFRDYLDGCGNSVFCLLADVADEVFQIEDIPHVRGGDRREIINRKLAQHFQGSPLTLAVSRGRLSAGRRDERLLLVGLTRPAQFEPWLAAMRNKRCRIEGVFSLPQMVAALIAESLPDGTELVLSVGRAGVRQTFFENDQLRLSRLSPPGHGGLDDVTEIAATCAAEAGKMFQYLAGQRLIDRNGPLTTRVLAHPSQFDVFRAQWPDTPDNRLELVDITALAKAHGLAPPPDGAGSDRLFLHLLGRRRPARQFAAEEDRRFFRLGQARLALRAGAAAILAACLLVAGENALTWSGATTDNEASRLDIALAERRYRALLDGLPKTPLSTDEIRALTDRHAALLKRGEALEPTLRHISRALTRVPPVDLTRLDWRVVDHYPEEEADDKARDRNPVAPAASGTDGHVVVGLQAQLPSGMIGDHRAQLAAVDAFVGALRQGDVQVRVLALPFETESGKLLRSSDADGPTEAPRFSLRMVSRP